jgi:ASC-1-like (ASCH) protein
MQGKTVANCHLVILKKPYLDMILEGRKLIELRLYKTRRGAFGRVWAGDKLFLKVSSGPVCATATAEAVKNFENLTPEKILGLRRLYNHDIGGPEEYWQSKIDCKFGLLVWLKDVRAIEPARIHKKDWRAWVVLTENRNFGLLKMDGPR